MKQHSNFYVILYCFICWIIHLPVVAQYHNVKFERYSTDNGLPSNEVFQVYQDRKGFIWVATKDGLARFDGYAFQVFKHHPQDSTSLSSNTVRCVYEDQLGNLWVGTALDLHRYDAATQTFRRIRTRYKVQAHEIYEKNPKGEILSNDINSIFEDRQGNLWITTNGEGLAMLNRQTLRFQYFLRNQKSTDALANNYTKSIAADKTGNLWVATDVGLCVLQHSHLPTGSFTTYYPAPHKTTGLPSGFIKSIAIDEENTVWIGSDGGLSKLTAANRQQAIFQNFGHDPKKTYSLSNNYVKNVYLDSQHNVWVCTDAGVARLSAAHQQHGIFENFYHDSADPSSIIATYAKSVFEDRFGQIWVACHGGLSKFDPQRERFELYQQHLKQTHPLPSNNIRAFCQTPDKTLWIGTNKGIAKVIDRNNLEKHFISYKNNPNNPTSLVNDYVNTLMASRIDASIWIGTDHGLAVMTKEGIFQNYLHNDHDANSLCKNTVTHIFEDIQGNIWVGTWDGISVVSVANRPKVIFKNYSTSTFNTSGNGQITAIIQTKDSTIWLASKSGLLRYDKHKDSFFAYTAQSQQWGLPNNELSTLYEDPNGALWVGTTGSGLLYFDRLTEQFTPFTEEDGLISNFIEGILADTQGYLWITTQKGLSRFLPPKSIDDTQKGVFLNFSSQDGLQGNEFLPRAILQDHTGKFYVGGTNGFSCFYPTQIKEEQSDMPVYITDFKLFNKSVKVGSGQTAILKQAIATTQELDLSYLDNFFSFDFTALTFRNAEKNKFAYQMEGFDKDWIEVDASKRFATYTNLSAGEYVFKVKAANSNGRWNEKGARIKIRIHPPVWEKLWFKTFAIGLCCVAIWAFYRYRIHQIESRRYVLETQVKQRTIELLDKNNELEAQKAEIAQQNFLLEAQKQEIIVQNEELQQQQEEILAQRDHISEKNKALEQQKTAIEKSYQNITILSEIGQKITASLEITALVGIVYDNISTLMYASAFGIGLYDENRQTISYTGFIERGEVLPYHEHPMTTPENLGVYCITNKTEILMNDFQSDIYTIFPHYKMNWQQTLGDTPISLIYLPLLLEQKVVGVITVQSFQRHAYTQNHLSMLKSLASYISIALDNSRAYAQIAAANHEIALQNSQIMDSIRYGKTIQEALLPNPKDMADLLGDYFVFFQPKDVVSGDFYWVGKTQTGTMVAVVDCTGHGVPGAFMSMIGMSLLHEAINQQDMTTPSEVLDYINHEIQYALKQHETNNRDGMDVCLCKIEKQEYNTKITFAGAKRHLYGVYQEDVIDLKGSRKNIGGRQKDDKQFNNEVVDMAHGTMLYLTTDGYADQANKDREKFGVLRLIALFKEIAPQPVAWQKTQVIEHMRRYQGQTAQRDDMTILGIRI